MNNLNRSYPSDYKCKDMIQEIIKKSQAIQIRLQACLTRHYTLRENHQELKSGYQDMFFTNDYMYVKDVQALVRAEEEYNNEYGRFLSAGAAIGSLESKLNLVPIMLRAQELIGGAPADENKLRKHLETINECEHDVERIEGYYDEHEANYIEQKKIYNEVTQRKN